MNDSKGLQSQVPPKDPNTIIKVLLGGCGLVPVCVLMVTMIFGCLSIFVNLDPQLFRSILVDELGFFSPIEAEIYGIEHPSHSMTKLAQKPDSSLSFKNNEDVRNYIGQLEISPLNYIDDSIFIKLFNNNSLVDVQLEKYLLIEVGEYIPVEEDVNVLSDIARGSGGFYERSFVVHLSSTSLGVNKAIFEEEPEELIHEELFREEIEKHNSPDYFFLEPGEFDIYQIDLKFDEPGRYILKIGFEYFHNGKWHDYWLDDCLEFFIPESFSAFSIKNNELDHLSIYYTGECKYSYEELELLNFGHYECNWFAD